MVSAVHRPERGCPEPGIPLGSARSFAGLPFPGALRPGLGGAGMEEGIAPNVLNARSGDRPSAWSAAGPGVLPGGGSFPPGPTWLTWRRPSF